MEYDPRYTWVLPQSAWYLRLYRWAWGADRHRVTFCKLFWGYAFMWLALTVRLLAVPVEVVLNGHSAAKEYRRRHRKSQPKSQPKATESKPKVAKPKPRPYPDISLPLRRVVAGREVTLLAWVKKLPSAGLGRIYEWQIEDRKIHSNNMGNLETEKFTFNEPGTYRVRVRTNYGWAQETVRVYPEPGLPIRFLERVAEIGAWIVMHVGPPVLKGLRLLTIVAFIGGTLFAIAELALNAASIGAAFASAGSAVGHGASVAWRETTLSIRHGWYYGVGVVGGVVLLWLATAWGIIHAIDAVLLRPTVRGTKRGALGFRQVMILGFKSVKSNTCPRIEVAADETVADEETL